MAPAARALEGVRRDEAVGPHRQTPPTGTLFQPHWKLDGGRDAASAIDVEVGHALEPFGHHDRDLQAGEVDAEAEVLAAAERQQPLDRPVPDELVGIGYSRSSRLADASSVMIRCPGSIVVSWIVNGLRTVRANHCAGAQ